MLNKAEQIILARVLLYYIKFLLPRQLAAGAEQKLGPGIAPGLNTFSFTRPVFTDTQGRLAGVSAVTRDVSEEKR